MTYNEDFFYVHTFSRKTDCLNIDNPFPLRHFRYPFSAEFWRHRKWRYQIKEIKILNISHEACKE